jgi:hypothetical protein
MLGTEGHLFFRNCSTVGNARSFATWKELCASWCPTSAPTVERKSVSTHTERRAAIAG